MTVEGLAPRVETGGERGGCQGGCQGGETGRRDRVGFTRRDRT